MFTCIFLSNDFIDYLYIYTTIIIIEYILYYRLLIYYINFLIVGLKNRFSMRDIAIKYMESLKKSQNT